MFIYSEKATKFCEIFTLLLSYVVPVKSKVKISQNFVAISEYMNFIYLSNLIIIYNSRLVELTEIRRHGYVFRMDYESFLSRYKMLSVHTWPHWTAGGPVDGVTCLLRDLPISANEYSFGRSKIFIRTSKTVRFSKILPNFCWLVFDPIDI